MLPLIILIPFAIFGIYTFVCGVYGIKSKRYNWMGKLISIGEIIGGSIVFVSMITSIIIFLCK
jgi:hypothetical protein